MGIIASIILMIVSFSGGEMTRHSVMQLDLLKPMFAILDETDSGLDVDALRVVSEGINRFSTSTTVASCTQ